ncbi:MAG TPA: c-type cytochrome domain-containing protein, partial [Bryobacteraceae bacterium]|nr:c-type cytochrome domain-containing protein [Bryobacteraceae bacterium]
MLLVASAAFAPGAGGQPNFSSEVAPLLKDKCVACHGPAQQMAALNLSSSEALLKGGQNGPSVIPGKAADSRLYKRVAGLEQPAMPLGNKLSDREVQILKDWIDNGARWEG